MTDTESNAGDYYSDSDDESESPNNSDHIVHDDSDFWEPQSTVEETSGVPSSSTPLSDHSDGQPSSPCPVNINSGRQNIETNLRQPIFVEKYSDKYANSHAGEPVPNIPSDTPAFAKYSSKIANSETNPYAPFANKINWDIARWAKLRGPGSNSLAELLAVEGVCVLTVYIFELNPKIY